MTGRIEIWHDDNLIKSVLFESTRHRNSIINEYKKKAKNTWLQWHISIIYSQKSFNYAAKLGEAKWV